MIPISGKAELHIMYDCTLACVNCNRLSVLRTPHTEPMSGTELDAIGAAHWWGARGLAQICRGATQEVWLAHEPNVV